MRFSFFDIFWIIFLVASFLPVLRQRRVEQLRLRAMQRIQSQRGSVIITLIHRQESMSFLGLFTRRFINIEDSEQVLRAIRFAPSNTPIDLVLHTPGGLVLAAEQIAHALRKHPGRVTVFVPHYAMSGGTLVALAADEIWVDENAVLGPIDPQLGNLPAASVLKAVEQKDVNKLEDQTLILADVARKAVRQVEDLVFEILKDRMGDEKARSTAKVFTEGRWTHDYPITCEELQAMGLPVKCGLPREIYQLMELYPQPPQRRPSVQYIPVPARGEARYGRDEI